VHVYLSARAFVGPVDFPVQPAATPHPAIALRHRIWQAGAESTDARTKARFLKRYPVEAAFDAWELKRFLQLSPDAQVVGIDEVPLPTGTPGEVFAVSSRLPDDDLRNRDRFHHDAHRQMERDPYGQPLPEDPATLEMGALTGLSSQAHAHYGLPHLSFSDDPEVLKRDPRRFAVPPTVHTFGAAFAETYVALAVLAQSLPDGGRLSWVLAGAAAHHLEDVANQIHTVQVGLYAFFVDAKLESIKADLVTIGGLTGSRPAFRAIGIGILANHHVLAESLFAKHLLTPGDPVAVASPNTAADPTYAIALEQLAGCAPGFGANIAEALIERSSHEGPDVYRTIRDAAERRWSRRGQHFEEIDDPDRAIRQGADLGAFFALEQRGAARSDQAVRALLTRLALCGQSPEAAPAFGAALVRAHLDTLDEAEGRFQAYRPTPPARESIAVWVPTLYVLLLGVTIVLVRRAARRTK
jgi:hypothetical protein